MKKMIVILTFCLCLSAWGAAGAGPIEVFVSIPPQKYFVEKIGGGLVQVSVMVPPGASPATYEPKPRQMSALAVTKAYMAIGVPFEKNWLGKISAANPKMKIVQTDQGIIKRTMAAHPHTDHEEAGAESHEHEGLPDPHIWTAPPLVKIQAQNILQALTGIDPANRSIYQTNYEKFVQEIEALDAELKEIFAGREGKVRFMVFHPAWGYLAEAYGLEQIPVELEGKEPKPAQLKELIESAKRLNIKIVFVQPQFSTKSAEVIAKAIGGEVVLADPLAQDWAENLRKQAARFKAALR